MAKNLVLGMILADLAQIFFLQKSGLISHQTSWSAIIMYNIKKTNDAILRKRTDGQREGHTDRWTRVIL